MLFPSGTSGFLFFSSSRRTPWEGLRSIVPTMRWGRYGSSRDEAAVCEFPVIYFADILSKGFVIEELFYGWIYTEILIVLRYIYSDFLIIARTYKKGKTIKIFSKP